MNRQYWLDARRGWRWTLAGWLIAAMPAAFVATHLAIQPTVLPKMLGVLLAVCWCGGTLNAASALATCRHALTLFTDTGDTNG